MTVMITLNQIREHDPCEDGWTKLLKAKGKTEADEEPFPLSDVLYSNGLDDCLWCLRCLGPEHKRWIRRLACDYALDVIHLWNAPEVVREYLTTQNPAQRKPAREAAAREAAWSAAEAAARAAAWSAGEAAARAAAELRAKQEARLREELDKQ